jgi:hypothetical protein
MCCCVGLWIVSGVRVLAGLSEGCVGIEELRTGLWWAVLGCLLFCLADLGWPLRLFGDKSTFTKS